MTPRSSGAFGARRLRCVCGACGGCWGYAGHAMKGARPEGVTKVLMWALVLGLVVVMVSVLLYLNGAVGPPLR